MRFLTEQQIRELEAEALAREIADEAEHLCKRARSAGCIVEVHTIADAFSVVTVRPRISLQAARDCVVAA